MMKIPRLVLAAAGALFACSSAASAGPLAAAAQGQASSGQTGSGRYRVQLGIFAQQTDAQQSRARFEARFGQQLQGIVVIPPSDSETQYRVASAPMTAQAAEAACAKLIEAHVSCAVVKR